MSVGVAVPVRATPGATGSVWITVASWRQDTGEGEKEAQDSGSIQPGQGVGLGLGDFPW